jgi:putative ABC transport system ATP-binding protein
LGIKLENISKSFKSGDSSITLFTDLNLEINLGEWVTLIGPSGSGKSTILNIIYGIQSPDTGKVSINGKNMYGLKDKELQKFRRENLAVVFQDFKLIPQFNVIENVILPLLPYEKYNNLYHSGLKILDMLGMAKYPNKYPSDLSGGEKQRVSIARSLMTKPKYILCDEPTGNLDSKNRDSFLAILSDLNKQGITLVVVTHDDNVAKKGNRILQLEEQSLKEVILCSGS